MIAIVLNHIKWLTDVEIVSGDISYLRIDQRYLISDLISSEHLYLALTWSEGAASNHYIVWAKDQS